ncbi:MAG TPA: hypothetical protein VKA36_06070 [Solirubrobacterales bacterium]|nr:hypothetical protein [Solirubrobacterales bacterium]
MRGRWRTALLAAGALAALAAGCGAEDFPNDPRPPAPIELTARIGDEKVVVSPTQTQSGEPIGAGLANVTISNQTGDDVRLEFTGPADETTDPVIANGVLEFKIDLEEGVYTVSAEDPRIDSTEFDVGPERPSAQNDLLLP